MSAEPADRLRALRAQAELDIRALDASIDAVTAARADANSDDEHDPEGATIAFERSQAEALRRAALQRLTEVDAALGRTAAGEVAHCSVCGTPIPLARLEARPTTTTCVRHA